VSVERLCRSALRFPGAAARVVPVPLASLRQQAPKAVVKPETMNYRTMLPEAGGLFDPRVFGAGTVIDAPLPDPDAPFKPRKTLFARIALAVPIVHPLVLAHAAEEGAALLGRSLARETGQSQLDHGKELAAALQANEATRDLVISELPVLPPDLRPLLRDEEDRWAATPLNRWYQRILYANARIAKHVEAGNLTVMSVATEYSEIVTLVHRLFENDELPEPERDPDGKPLPSLRTLCGGTAKLAATIEKLPATADGEVSGRDHVARAVLYAMGFAVA